VEPEETSLCSTLQKKSQTGKIHGEGISTDNSGIRQQGVTKICLSLLNKRMQASTTVAEARE